MKKILGVILTVILFMTVLYFVFIYYATFSEGVRSGELIKISKKRVIVKTWEGEISQGISGAQIFSFSVESKNKSEKVLGGRKFSENSEFPGLFSENSAFSVVSNI